MESKQNSDKSPELAALVEAGDWNIKEKEFSEFVEYNPDSLSNEDFVPVFQSGVTFGNDRFSFTLEHKESDDVHILYSQTSPAEKYKSSAEKEQTFKFNFGNENFEDPVTYENTKYGSSILEDISMADIGKTITALKEFISDYFTDKELISPEYAPQYKAIRDNGTSFFAQRKKALESYLQNLVKQPKLSPKELSDLAVYYDNRVYKNLASTGKEDMTNAVKWMLEDGLKPSQINIIGRNMISCDPLDQDLVKKVLQSPEIKKFQQELKSKAVSANKAK